MQTRTKINEKTIKKSINSTKASSTTSKLSQKSIDPEKKKILNKDAEKKTHPKPSTSIALSSNSILKKSKQPMKATTQIQPERRIKPTIAVKSGSQLPKSHPIPVKQLLMDKFSHMKIIQPRIIPKTNVMNTIHSVTVTSPTPKRREVISNEKLSKETIHEKLSQEAEFFSNEQSIRIRTRTRTLEPEEVTILMNNAQDSKNLDLKIKEPVAYEINFQKKDVENEFQNKKEQDTNTINGDDIQEEPDYDDDFESYESDFETGSSSAEAEVSENGIFKCVTESTTEISEDESEETLPQITVIHRDEERKLDSGNYDLNSKKNSSNQTQQPDSIDTSTTNSEQLDSGISYSGKLIRNKNILSKPVLMSKRGEEIMKKIQLDDITYSLFELKPINYDYYMKIYGNFNTTQGVTQTNDKSLDTECQTDDTMLRSIWTQYPAQFNIEIGKENSFGEFIDDENYNSKLIPKDSLTKTIILLNKFKKNASKFHFHNQQIDFNHLNEFLNKSAFTISEIFKTNDKRKQLKSTRLSYSNGFQNFQAGMFNKMKISRIYSNSKLNLILLVHTKLENCKDDYLNLISVWNSNEFTKPIKLLSTWTDITRIEISLQASDIIVSGHCDGSISVWDLRETYSINKIFENDLKHFPPIQSITPNFNDKDLNLLDFGAVIHIRAFRTENRVSNYNLDKPIQFVSLNESGILTIWTLIDINNNNFSEVTQINSLKIEYNSPLARTKLIQSEICDLRKYLQLKNVKIQTKFDKTRSYFESDLFNDDALKELQGINEDLILGLEGLRFTSLDVGIEKIFIATNRNFLIKCTKTLKLDRFRKIICNESKLLFPTILKLLSNDEFLLIGLSNGSIIALNCNQNKPQNNENKTNKKSNVNINKSIDADLEIGKSCAIQNIIRNERKSFETTEMPSVSDLKKINLNLEKNYVKLNFNYKIYDQQILLGDSILRNHMIRNIEITNDGSKLFALIDGCIRCYDFKIQKEILGNELNEYAMGISLVKENRNHEQLLVLLTKKNEIQIHAIKN